MQHSLIFLLSLVNFIGCEEHKTFEEFFEIGREAYLSNDWQECALNMEKSVKSYNEFSEIMLACQESCRDLKFDSLLDLAENDDLKFYEKKIRSTLCLIQCKNLKLGVQKSSQYASEATKALFESKEPYNYMQLCYHQVMIPVM